MVRTSSLAILIVAPLAFACGKSEGRRSSAESGQDAGGFPSGGGGPSGASGAGASGASGELSHVLLDGHPLYTRVQRLTNRQWEHAVTDVLRFSEVHGLSKSFARPPFDESEFDNNERALFVGQQNFLDFEAGAEAAAALATGSPAALAAMYDGDDAAGFVATLGRRAFRRPLTGLEQAKYEQVFALGERIYGAGFANGAALVVRAIFQSPHFLYRTELGASGEPLNGYELASKLSFWLLGTTPSDALLDAAAAGDLDSDAGLASLTKDLLADPRAVETMRDFHEQLLAVQQFEAISKAGVPEYDAAINGELVLAPAHEPRRARLRLQLQPHRDYSGATARTTPSTKCLRTSDNGLFNTSAIVLRATVSPAPTSSRHKPTPSSMSSA